MEFGIGWIVKVTGNIHGHQFKIGQIVKIIEHDNSSEAEWLCSDVYKEYWLSTDEFENY